MLEFLRDLSRLLFGVRADSYLPDCRAILFTIKSAQQLDPRSADRFVALCRLTAVVQAIRWACILLLAVTFVFALERANARTVATGALFLVVGIATFGALARLSRFLANDYQTGIRLER
jgi:membrane protein YdbS with pleckstrin-like domain